MFLERIIVTDYVLPSGRIWKNKHLARVMCDNESCKKIREIPKPGKIAKRKFHYCNRVCAGKDEKRRNRIKISNKRAHKQEHVKKKIRDRLQEKYGVSFFSQTTKWKKDMQENQLERIAKCLKTKKENETYKKSKSEDACYERLCELFGQEDVVRQVRIDGTRWFIDFYVKSIDTYVQFDGIYWHGLDRSLDEIKRFKTKRDRSIYTKWCSDRKQDEWFLVNKKILIRIREDELSQIESFFQEAA